MKLSAAAAQFLVFSLVLLEVDADSSNKKNKSKKKSKKNSKVGKNSSDSRVPTDLPNVLWLLVDDVSTERYPESGNEALRGLLPGLDELKADGAVYYSHFYSPSSVCAPSQVALFSGMDPANIGGHHQFAADASEQKANYFTVPPPEVEFLPEKLRELGYWSTGGGKLDYQVGDVMPTFYNKILGGAFSDINSYMEQTWTPAIEQDRPFFGMLNIMDNHQFISTFSREVPVPISGVPPGDLPFGQFGYTTPLSLLYSGPGGAAVPGITVQEDLLATDILGYRGSLNETALTHENGGVPGYLPEDIGIKSILAKEYDLLRNVDYRLSTIIRRLKELDVYDNTMIVLFGDHGSGVYKAKFLMQPQSVRTPLWIKYPVGTTLSSAVETEADDGTLVDTRMSGITDLYPTTLSTLGVQPKDYMTGRALAGIHEDTRKEREIMYALHGRSGGLQGWKSFCAFTKEHFYQRHLLTSKAIDARELVGEDPAVIADARRDATYESRYDIFPAAPIYDRLQRLMLVNAQDPMYPDKYKVITANGATPPSEVLYDVTNDPYGTENLIIDSTFHVGVSPEIQKWGNNVANVTISYSDVDESSLDKKHGKSLKKLRKALDKWIDGQQFVTNALDWSEGLYGEENKMAREFWPNGVQPSTSLVELSSDGTLSSATPGTVFRYALVSPEERNACESLGADAKSSIAEMTPFNSGFVAVEYVSLRNGRTYIGYLYNEANGREVAFTTPLGEVSECQVFFAVDGTFMELDCPTQQPFAFDSRDSTWNGETWVGVDPVSGAWLGEPILFFDFDKKNWNFDAFAFYMFGPNRNEIYSGLNADGTSFVSVTPADKPLNIGFNAAPSYFATDEDVNAFPQRFDDDESIIIKGYGLVEQRSVYYSAETNGLDNKGSFDISLNARWMLPPQNFQSLFRFASFRYECLLWDVGNEVDFGDLSEGERLHVFTQGVRKGYSDSVISERVVESYGSGGVTFI